MSSTGYSTDHSASVLRTHSWRTAANSAAYLIPHLKANMTILDIGCGPASISIDLARLVPQGHLTGIEPVPDPLEGARKLASEAGVTNISFQVADTHSLPFDDNTFDIVHVHQVLQHISDPVNGLREMRRVVKPGGLVACRESASMTWYPPSKKLDAWHDLNKNLIRKKGGNLEAGSYIHVWAERAGFDQAKIRKSAASWCFSSEEEREYWWGSMQERITGSAFAKFAVEEGLATEEELKGMADGLGEYKKNPQAWIGVLHGEILCQK